jgi:hypothetical protein
MHDLGDPKFFICCFHLFPLVMKKKWLQFQDYDGDGGDDGKNGDDDGEAGGGGGGGGEEEE